MKDAFAMRNLYSLTTGLLSMVLLLVATPLAWSANFPPVEVEGKIVGFGKMEVYVVTSDGKKIAANVNPDRIDGPVRITGIPNPKVTIVGKENVDFLKNGMYVRFHAKLIGTVKSLVLARDESIAEVEVFTPEKDAVFGAMPEGLGDPPKRITEPLKHFVVGQIASVKRGSLTVNVPKGKVKVRLAKDAVVKLNVSDARYARKGDKISVKGFAATPPKVFATEIIIDRGSSIEGDEGDKKDGKKEEKKVDNKE